MGWWYTLMSFFWKETFGPSSTSESWFDRSWNWTLKERGLVSLFKGNEFGVPNIIKQHRRIRLSRFCYNKFWLNKNCHELRKVYLEYTVDTLLSRTILYFLNLVSFTRLTLLVETEGYLFLYRNTYDLNESFNYLFICDL